MRLEMPLAVKKGQWTGRETYAFNISVQEQRQAGLWEFRARNFLYRVGKQINKFLKEEKRESTVCVWGGGGRTESHQLSVRLCENQGAEAIRWNDTGSQFPL